MQTRVFRQADEAEVIRLWSDCGLLTPHNDPRKDIERKLAYQPELFLVGEQDGRIVATVMAGYEGHRGWINYLAVTSELRQRGLARKLMLDAENRLRALGCPKINLMVRKTNTVVMDFYRGLGFQDDQVVCLGKRLEED